MNGEKENIFILTNERYNDLVFEQLPEVTQRQVVLEPTMRNTAPCILYASLKIQKEKFLLMVGVKQLKKLYPNIQLERENIV